MNIIGDVTDRPCLLVDDIVDSGGTLCDAAEALLANGAKSVLLISRMAFCRAKRSIG